MNEKDELAIYRTFLHRLAMAAQGLKAKERIQIYLGMVVDWSYAHRCGNGELPRDVQDELIGKATRALLEVGDLLYTHPHDASASRYQTIRRMLADPQFTSDALADAICSRNAKAIDAAVDAAMSAAAREGE